MNRLALEEETPERRSRAASLAYTMVGVPVAWRDAQGTIQLYTPTEQDEEGRRQSLQIDVMEAEAPVLLTGNASFA